MLGNDQENRISSLLALRTELSEGKGTLSIELLKASQELIMFS